MHFEKPLQAPVSPVVLSPAGFTTALPFNHSTWLRSNDLDAATERLVSHIEERRFSSMGGAPVDVHFTLQKLPQMHLFGAQFGSRIQVKSSPLQSWHGILPLCGAVTSRGKNHQVAAPGQLIMFTPGHEVDVVWEASTQAVVITLENSLLMDHLLHHHQIELPSVPPQACVIDARHPAMLSLNNLLRLLDQETRNTQSLFNNAVCRGQIQNLFCENLLGLIPCLNTLPQRSLLPGSVKRVVEYIQSNLDQPLTMDQLVVVAGVSRRSLEQAFRNTLETSPQRYIRQCRLRHIREVLQRSQPGELQLSELAHRWGFAQPSHFTAAYKEAFGELPSQTLARSV